MDFTSSKFKAATVQTSPIYFNVNATVDKACDIIREVGKNGAQLVAFPEVYICAYPYWNWLLNPVEGSKWFEKLYLNSISSDHPQIQKIAKTAKEVSCNVVIGMNERDEKKVGTLYNTTLIINHNGEMIGKHRKLVPTWAEKLTWTGGNGSSLKVYNTNVGPLGTLACGENTNTLARFTLLAEGELIHIANYISLPVAPVNYNMSEAIKIRAAAHSFEGKIFTLVSCSVITEEIIKTFEKENPKAREILSRKNSAFTGILNPQGQVVGEPLIDVEGIVYADIDLKECIQPKQMHDIIGGYNRFDVFNLTVNKRTQNAITFTEDVFQEEKPIEFNYTN